MVSDKTSFYLTGYTDRAGISREVSREDRLVIEKIPESGETGRCVYLREGGQRFTAALRIPRFVVKTTTVEFHLSGAALSNAPVLDMQYEDDQLVACTLSRAGTPFKAEFSIVRAVQFAEPRRTSASGLMPLAPISVCTDSSTPTVPSTPVTFEEEKVDTPRKKTGLDYVKGLIAASPRSTDSATAVLPAVVKAVKKMSKANKKLSKRLSKRRTKKAPTKGRKKSGNKLTKKTLKKKRKGAKGKSPRKSEIRI